MPNRVMSWFNNKSKNRPHSNPDIHDMLPNFTQDQMNLIWNAWYRFHDNNYNGFDELKAMIINKLTNGYNPGQPKKRGYNHLESWALTDFEDCLMMRYKMPVGVFNYLIDAKTGKAWLQTRDSGTTHYPDYIYEVVLQDYIMTNNRNANRSEFLLICNGFDLDLSHACRCTNENT